MSVFQFTGKIVSTSASYLRDDVITFFEPLVDIVPLIEESTVMLAGWETQAEAVVDQSPTRTY